MLEQILQYSENDKISLLIRHSDREKIPTSEFGNDVLLNETGKERAFNFGKNLSNLKINKILTSPVGRCVQTAEQIVKGYGKSVEIEETQALGDPGLHITDGEVAGQFFLTAGFDEMYHRIINDLPIPGMPDAEDFNNAMTAFLIEHTLGKGLTIFVTHDLLIAFYHYSINKTVYTQEDWVKYLGGLTLKNGRYEE